MGLVLCSALAIGACGSSSDDNLFSSSKGGSGGNSSGGANTGGSGGNNTGGTKTGGTGGTGAVGGSSGGTGGTAGLPSGGSAGVGTGGAATGGTGGTGGITLDNVCQTMAPKVCALRQTCCTQVYGFDENQCVANETADCNDKVSQVNAGDKTFDASLVDACLAAITPLYAACYFSGDQLAPFELAVNVCDAMFDPVGAGPGTDCTRAQDCTASTAPNGIVECNNGQCDQGQVLQSGGDCSGINLCAPGLYCQNEFSNQSCQQAVPVGGNCNSSTQCGAGYYCTGFHCAKAQPGGSQCNSDSACLSLSCTFPGFPPGTCDDQSVYVTQSQCGM